MPRYVLHDLTQVRPCFPWVNPAQAMPQTPLLMSVCIWLACCCIYACWAHTSRPLLLRLCLSLLQCAHLFEASHPSSHNSHVIVPTGCAIWRHQACTCARVFACCHANMFVCCYFPCVPTTCTPFQGVHPTYCTLYFSQVAHGAKVLPIHFALLTYSLTSLIGTLVLYLRFVTG